MIPLWFVIGTVMVLVVSSVLVNHFYQRSIPEHVALTPQEQYERLRRIARNLIISSIVFAWFVPAALFVIGGVAQESEKTAVRTREIANELCEQTIGWQQATLIDRRSAVRLVRAELAVARIAKENAHAALEEARVVVGDDEPPSPAEEFFLDVFGRDAERSDHHVIALADELIAREEQLETLQETALAQCPPVETGAAPQVVQSSP